LIDIDFEDEETEFRQQIWLLRVGRLTKKWDTAKGVDPYYVNEH